MPSHSRARDRALSTSLRVRAPQETLAVATVVGARLGIAACVDAVRDDVLGVPVWFSFRPGGKTRTVHAGKGMFDIDARTGAWMEGIEFAAAERAAEQSGCERCSLGDLLAQFGPDLTVADLAPRLGAPVPLERDLPVETCEDVASGRVYRLPAELLRLRAPECGPLGPAFGSSSNGLASGNSLDEATLHALLEVLERDCIALDLVKPAARWIDPASLPAPFARWTARWATLGIVLRVRHVPNEFGLTCLCADLVEPGSTPSRRSLGWGMHPDPLISLARAVTEAAQSRLYGLRFPDGVEPPPGADPGTEPRGNLAFSELAMRPGAACETVSGALSDLLARLRAVGMPWVLRRSMNLDPAAADLDGLHVVKVVVPGCESALGGGVRIGRRLARRLVQAA